MTTLLELSDVEKRYDNGTLALERVNLKVGQHEFVSLLGPSGCGKSTALKMIAGLSPVTAGSIVWSDSIDDHAKDISFVFQEPTLMPWTKVFENVWLPLRLKGVSLETAKPMVNAVLEKVGLSQFAHVYPRELSGGMKRRLTIARGLINEPEILLLDEPTTGLDPQARHILWDRLFRLKELGVTLVITTHYMDEAEQLCDRLVVMDKGKIMAEGSPAELIKKYSSKEVLEVRFGSANNEQVAKDLAGVGERLEILPDRILVYTSNGEKELEKIVKKGLKPVTSLVRRSSLEDVFLRLTGRSLVE